MLCFSIWEVEQGSHLSSESGVENGAMLLRKNEAQRARFVKEIFSSSITALAAALENVKQDAFLELMEVRWGGTNAGETLIRIIIQNWTER